MLERIPFNQQPLISMIVHLDSNFYGESSQLKWPLCTAGG